MNILFTICGRAGSKGFKNKNLKIDAIEIQKEIYELGSETLKINKINYC